MHSSSKSPFLLKASAVYVTALLSCVFVFIIVCAADGFFMGGRGLFTSVWHPESKQFGILPVMAATAALCMSDSSHDRTSDEQNPTEISDCCSCSTWSWSRDKVGTTMMVSPFLMRARIWKIADLPKDVGAITRRS